MGLPLYIKPTKECNDVFNIDDPLLQYLIEDNFDGEYRTIIFEFPKEYIFNLKSYQDDVMNGVYSDFELIPNSNGSKRVVVIL